MRPGSAVQNGQLHIPVLNAVTAFAVVQQRQAECPPAVIPADVNPCLPGFFVSVHRPFNKSVWNGIREFAFSHYRGDAQFKHLLQFMPVEGYQTIEFPGITVQGKTLDDKRIAVVCFDLQYGSFGTCFDDGEFRLPELPCDLVVSLDIMPPGIAGIIQNDRNGPGFRL